MTERPKLKSVIRIWDVKSEEGVRFSAGKMDESSISLLDSSCLRTHCFASCSCGGLIIEGALVQYGIERYPDAAKERD